MAFRVTLSMKQVALLIQLFNYLDRSGVDFAIAPELQELWGRLMTVQGKNSS